MRPSAFLALLLATGASALQPPRVRVGRCTARGRDTQRRKVLPFDETVRRLVDPVHRALVEASALTAGDAAVGLLQAGQKLLYVKLIFFNGPGAVASNAASADGVLAKWLAVQCALAYVLVVTSFAFPEGPVGAGGYY
ncbi:hypothetical protein M885DRAFT_570970 [Pelagophyceae sp. CCMP2097]|nr:hypothetical protein M885DRAFT_570970 [Pelagophyceae sp. CCMP2097]